MLVGNIFHIKPDRKSTKTYIMQCSTIFINSFLDEVYELEKAEEEDESYSYLKWVYLLIICLILTIAYFIKKYVKRHTGVYKTKGQEISEGNCGVFKYFKNPTFFSRISAIKSKMGQIKKVLYYYVQLLISMINIQHMRNLTIVCLLKMEYV